MRKPPRSIAPHRGKLAVLLPGMGAVATTFIGGCMCWRAVERASRSAR